MFTEERKNHLIEDVLRTTDEATLVELESLMNKKRSKNKPDIYKLLGILTPTEGEEMRKIIAETCEIINPDDWK